MRGKDTSRDLHDEHDLGIQGSPGELRNLPVCTVVAKGQTVSTGERRRKTDGKEYDTPPPIPCTLKEVNALLDKWIAYGVFKPNLVFREPTKEEWRDPRFCRLHNYVQHPIGEC